MKVLHESVIEQSGFLEAFRRGVRAMKILSDASVKGMVKYVRGFDIPASVIMEYIEGEDFEQAIVSRQITTLRDSLQVVRAVGDIVLRGHNLDKQVLHRDLKPGNVMLRDFHTSEEPVNDVVVLDFDLSWYEGAMGRSMMEGAHLHNYIAPEQAAPRPNMSSRHTAVDVYGLGMLLYFAATGVHPIINAQRASGFREETAKLIRSRWRIPFESVPEYLALVIQAATVDDQRERPSMALLIEQIDIAARLLASESIETPNDIANLEMAVAFLQAGWEAMPRPLLNFELVAAGDHDGYATSCLASSAALC